MPGIWSLIRSDYVARYGPRGEAPRRLRSRLPARLATDASLHAVVLVRLSCGSPRWTAWLWRRLLVSKHATDWVRGCTVGPGLELPHPYGMTIGGNVVIGRNVRVFQNVSVGPTRTGRDYDPEARLHIGDGAQVLPGSIILGEISIGAGAIVGPKELVLSDVPAGGVTRPAAEPPRSGAGQE